MRQLFGILVVLGFLASACAPAAPSDPSGDPGPKHRPDTWRVIAQSPLKAGYGYKAVWSGKEMLVWGGGYSDPETLRHVAQRGGAAYNPRKDRWRVLPKAPIAGGSGYSVTWAGDEMIVWGDPDRGRSTKGNRGAAFNPASNEWRRLPSGPLAGRSGHLAIWTGKELVVWGGSLTAFERERYDGKGAAFDPETNSWRVLSSSPLPHGYDAMGAWTGRDVLVMATPMGIDPEDYPKFAELAAYDPAADSWRSLARPTQVAHVSPPVAYVDGKLNVLSLFGTVDGGEVNGYRRAYETGGIYDHSSDEWSPHADPPKRPNQTWEQTAMGDEVVIDALAYRPATDTWRTLPEFPLREREFPVVVWTGIELIVWGGAKEPRGNVIVDPPPALNDGAAYTPPTE
jgi:N-acetylneuraminic acid mutarotase